MRERNAMTYQRQRNPARRARRRKTSEQARQAGNRNHTATGSERGMSASSKHEPGFQDRKPSLAELTPVCRETYRRAFVAGAGRKMMGRVCARRTSAGRGDDRVASG